MRRQLLMALLTAMALAVAAPLPAQAAGFGFKSLALKITEGASKPGSPAAQAASMQAGSHPFALVTELGLNSEVDPELGGEIPIGQLKDLVGEASAGLTGDPFAVPQCSAVDFATTDKASGIEKPSCSDSSVVGLVENEVTLADNTTALSVNSVYNLVPPPGVAARIGFLAYGGPVPPVTIDIGIKETPPYNLTFSVRNVTQMLRVFSANLTVWGNPSDPVHEEDRGTCGLFLQKEGGIPAQVEGKCPTSNPNRPFLTLPRSCAGPISTSVFATSWLGDTFKGGAQTEYEGSPLGVGGCAKLPYAPQISADPTSDRAASPSGLDFHLDVADEGLTAHDGRASSDLKKAVVTLPEGVTINPSQAEGLAVCSEADFAREGADSPFGAGCPAASKIGTVEVETPILEGKILKGSLFVAEPYKNRFGSLIALFMTIKEPDLGIGIKLAGKVEPDPRTGQLIATFDDLPQQPFSHFRLHFREGGRSPLITPPRCGTYTTDALFTPWANPQSPVRASAPFKITGGVNGAPCPSGPAPFKPGFQAGTLNNEAGHHSPFYMRLTRRDGDQDLTRFSAKLPPGLVAKLAGTGFCPPAQIVLAKAKTGKAELASPSCPTYSLIGKAIAGAGVGSQLTYVEGKIYLAGPYKGAPLSVVAIVPAVAGPFDVGTVVTQQALRVDPRTGEVSADGASSDPIPHILAGIPLSVRDIRVYIDKPEFTLNPTSCEPFQTLAEIWGGGSDVFSSADDSPLSAAARFQASNCRNLGFKPSLALALKGGTKRGDHPKLRGVYRPRPGDANLEDLVLRLPRSAFLDQGHIRTICTRVQFAAHDCPKGAIYGHARAFTPILSEPLEGPVYLRSSNHNLPDFVADLHGLVDVEAVARIDSKHGGIRATFNRVPDAPLSKVVVNMQGGKKGLIVNSTSLCAAKHRANASMDAHNGRGLQSRPLMRASCRG
jgi:hypothetical protein